jgi:hypothetical protein
VEKYFHLEVIQVKKEREREREEATRVSKDKDQRKEKYHTKVVVQDFRTYPWVIV